MLDVKAEMVRAHRPLEQARPQEQRAEHRICEENRDHDNRPAEVSKSPWSALFALRSGDTYHPLPPWPTFAQSSPKESNVVRDPGARCPAAQSQRSTVRLFACGHLHHDRQRLRVGRDRRGFRGHVRTDAWPGPILEAFGFV